jgi:hypothetical protein
MGAGSTGAHWAQGLDRFGDRDLKESAGTPPASNVTDTSGSFKRDDFALGTAKACVSSRKCILLSGCHPPGE